MENLISFGGSVSLFFFWGRSGFVFIEMDALVPEPPLTVVNSFLESMFRSLLTFNFLIVFMVVNFKS